MVIMYMRGAWLAFTADASLDSVKAIQSGPDHHLVNILPHLLPGFLHIFKLRKKEEVWQTAGQIAAQSAQATSCRAQVEGLSMHGTHVYVRRLAGCVWHACSQIRGRLSRDIGGSWSVFAVLPWDRALSTKSATIHS